MRSAAHERNLFIFLQEKIAQMRCLFEGRRKMKKNRCYFEKWKILKSLLNKLAVKIPRIGKRKKEKDTHTTDRFGTPAATENWIIRT